MDAVATTPLAWLVDWFAERNGMSAAEVEARRDVNFIDAGLLDSFGVIELIEAAEGAFDVRFGETHFQDRRFSTVGGLAEIIDSLRQP